MKKSNKLNRVLVLFSLSIMLLVTGCNNDNVVSDSTKNELNKDEKQLVCTKITADDKGVITETVDTFVYKNDILTSGEITDIINYSVYTNDLSYDETIEFFNQDVVKNKTCKPTWYDVSIFKGNITNCTQKWDNYLYYQTYYVNADKFKETQEDAKTIYALKDFHESKQWKCEIK